jgi:hypothetical protein
MSGGVEKIHEKKMPAMLVGIIKIPEVLAVCFLLFQVRLWFSFLFPV